MNISKWQLMADMKKMKSVFAGFATAAALAGYADPSVIEGAWNSGGISWKSTWSNGNIARITSMYNGTSKLSADINPYQVVFATSDYSPRFWAEDGNQLYIGAGGVVFEKPAVFSMGNRDKYSSGRKLRLVGSQTWSGTESGAYADVIVSTPSYYSGYYSNMALSYAANTVWTVERQLTVWLFSANNNLNEMEMVVKAPARLYIPQDFKINNTTQNPAVLKLRKLTLSGDGAGMLPLGTSVNYSSTYGGTGTLPPTVGMTTLMDESRVASTLELHDGADLTATKDTTFSIPNWIVSGEGESKLSGTFTFGLGEVAVTLADGVALDFAGTFKEVKAGTPFAATGSGSVSINLANWKLSGALTAGEGVTLNLTTSGGRLTTPVSGGGTLRLVVPDGEQLYVPETSLQGWTGTSLVVSGGKVLLDEKPVGVTVTTENGGSVIYGGGLVVTDKVRTETVLAVAAGETLEIYGNGLTAATAVTLGGGTNVRFHAAATVGASFALADGADGSWVTSYFHAPSSVTGTVAGVVNSGSGFTRIATDGPGCIVFAGGGELFGNSTFEVHGGSSAILSGGTYKVGATGACCITSRGTEANGTWGKYLGIRDGGRLVFAGDVTLRNVFYAKPLRDSSNYSRSSTIEIGEGGTVILPDNTSFYLGGDQNSGELILSGGTFKVGAGCILNFGKSGYSIGTLRFDSGTFETSSPIRLATPTDQTVVYWKGGTFKLGASYPDDTPIFTVTGNAGFDNVTRKFCVGILGDCTLDLSDLHADSVANTDKVTNRGEWYGNGKLTVRGGKTVVMRAMPNDIDIGIEGDGTRVEVNGDTRFFDYEKCVPYCKWRRPYAGGPDNYSSKDNGLEVDGLSVKTLCVADGAPSLVNTVATRVTTVANVAVASDGAWDNETSVSSVLRDITDMSMSENAVWRVMKRGADTVALTLRGTLDVPAHLRYLVIGSGMPDGMTLLSAASALTMAPEWTNAGTRLTAEPALNAEGTGFILKGGPGFSLIIR